MQWRGVSRTGTIGKQENVFNLFQDFSLFFPREIHFDLFIQDSFKLTNAVHTVKKLKILLQLNQLQNKL